MLDRRPILKIRFDRSLAQCLFGITTRFGAAFGGMSVRTLAPEVGDVWVGLIIDADQRRREARNLQRLGHHQRDGLRAVNDPIIVKRPERRAVRRAVVLVAGITVKPRKLS